MGLPATQMRLDSEGLALNDRSSISLVSGGLNAQGTKSLLEFTDSPLYFLMCSIAAVARLSFRADKPLPNNRERYHYGNPLLRLWFFRRPFSSDKRETGQC